MQYDILIKNATIFDGQNSSSFKSNILIKNGKILKIGAGVEEKDCLQIIDADKKYVCPGFIDINNSSDHYLTLLKNPSLDNFIKQGVTTIICGHCGSSLAPLTNGSLSTFDIWNQSKDINISWNTLKDFFKYLSKKPLGVNFGTLIGWNIIRNNLIGENFKNLTDLELKKLILLVKEGIKDGALGVSFGFGYPSGRAISKREVLAVYEATKKETTLFSFHLRDEANSFMTSLFEVLNIVKENKINTLISHFKAQGKDNFDNFPLGIKEISNLNSLTKSPYIHFDIYPYDYIVQSLYTLLPDWLTIGGRESIKNNLENKNTVKKLLKELKQNKDLFKNLILVDVDSKLQIFKGQTFESISKNLGLTLEETILHLLNLTQKQIVILNQNLSLKNIDQGIKSPYSIVSSNGSTFDSINPNKTFVHQRSVGTFPKLLKEYSKTLSFETLIYKITGLPAQKLNLKTKGAIKPNYDADITIFNPQTIMNTSTFQNPLSNPKGIDTVIINGQIVLKNGNIVNTSAGKIINNIK